MRVECPHCGQVGQLADSAVGKAVRCPKCQKKFKVDDESAPAAPETPPRPALRVGNPTIKILSYVAVGVGAVLVAIVLGLILKGVSAAIDTPDLTRDREQTNRIEENRRHQQELIRIMQQANPQGGGSAEEQIRRLEGATEALDKERQRHEKAGGQ
jgi:hypothetical protein